MKLRDQSIPRPDNAGDAPQASLIEDVSIAPPLEDPRAPGAGRIRVKDLEKTYIARKREGMFRSKRIEVHALRGVTIDIEPGEIFGIVGPNGAGKTTFIKCLSTLVLPSKGSAWVNGYQLGRDDEQIRASLGCMLMGERGLYWKLTGRENLLFFGALYHCNAAKRRRRAEELIEDFRLGEVADRPVETYSSGQKMTLAFARALLNNAPVLIFDEPTNTLDVPSARYLRAKVRALSEQGRTILYATHIMPEAESLCNRIAIIDHGRIVTVGAVSDLKASLQGDEVIRLEGLVPERARAALNTLPGVRHTSCDFAGETARITVVGHRTAVGLLPRVIETLTSQGAALHEIRREEVTLEDVFMAYTGHGSGENNANHG